MHRRLACAIWFSILLGAAPAAAHIEMMSPTARYVQDNNGLKTAPCGSGTATGTVTQLAPGQMLTVTWKESVSHAGHYRIALSANESDFVEPSSLDIPNPLPSWDLADGIQDKTGTQNYSQTVQIPNAQCPKCVLQLIQVMSTGTDGTNTGPFSGVYHACADLSITSGGSDAGPAPDAGGTLDARPEAGTRDAVDAGGLLRDAAMAAGGAGGTGGTTTTGGSKGSGGAGGGGTAGTPGTGGTSATGGTGGTGESNGSGGATATGRASSSTGGRSGTGGGSAAGGAGEGGQTGEGGSGGASGGSGGASNGSGGMTSGSGGNGGSQASSPASGGNTAQVPASSSNGCSCRTGTAASPGIGLAWLALPALWLSRRRKWEMGSRGRVAAKVVEGEH